MSVTIPDPFAALITAIADAIAARVQPAPAPAAPLPKFLTYGECAKQLRCSERQIRAMADAGTLRRVYPGGGSGMPRIPRSELDRIEAGRKLLGEKPR